MSADEHVVQDARTKPMQCPYCLGEFADAEMSDDHVIARSWFPEKTPPVAKWKVRSCQPCNNEKGVLERDLLGRLALCLNPNDPTLADIVARARRAMDPRSATTAREFVHRFNRGEAINRSLIDIRSKSAPGVLPYFTGNFDAGSRTGITVSARCLDGLVQRWVRGIHRCEVGRVVPAEYEVSVMHLDDQTRIEAFSDIIGHAKLTKKGPGVEVAIMHAEETDEFGTLYAFNVWNTLRCTASVQRTAEGASPV